MDGTGQATYHKSAASRAKHEGVSSVAQIVYDAAYSSWVGKCPMDMKNPQGLLREALVNGWYKVGDSGRPHAAWNIDDAGQVFRATITNVEQAEFHGFPERRADFEDAKRVPARIRRALEAKAKERDLHTAMRRWLAEQPDTEER